MVIPTPSSRKTTFVTSFLSKSRDISPRTITASDCVPVLPVIPAIIGIKNASATTVPNVSSNPLIILPEMSPINNNKINHGKTSCRSH